MPQGSKMAPAARGTGRLSALPDEDLHRVLSFLPSSEAVATCLLARGWRDVWKFARGLRVNGPDDYEYGSANNMNEFVNSLLLLRDDASPIDVVEINSYEYDHSVDEYEAFLVQKEPEAFRYLELWIRYGLTCGARVLCVRNNTRQVDRWCLPLEFITSKHLTVLELCNVELAVNDLDFSSCPVLENLRMEDCDFDTATSILSHSVKRLSMKSCLFPPYHRSEISFPNLIFMELAHSSGSIPQLQSMPLLVSSYVRLEDDGYCDTKDMPLLILGGLSNTSSLELTSLQELPILRNDLTWCPLFSKLKSLLLNDWCITDDLGALICFLQHSPMLEKLTLQFSKTLEELVEERASYDEVKEPFALDHLTVEVKCDNADDQRICRILDRLKLYGVPPEKIKVRQLPKLIKSNNCDGGTLISASFSSEQEEYSYDVDVDAAASSDSTDANDVDAAASSDSTDANDVDAAASSDTTDANDVDAAASSDSTAATSFDSTDAASSESPDYID